MGPNGLMAVAAGDQVRLYDTDNRQKFVTSLKPGLGGRTRQMRFSPTGTLALAGWGGPIEIWDPAAASRVGLTSVAAIEPEWSVTSMTEACETGAL